MFTRYEEFQRRLDDDPTDSGCRLTLADWLDDQRRFDEAAAWRWLGENKKMPVYLPKNEYPEFVGWNWTQKGNRDYPDSVLLISSEQMNTFGLWDAFPTRREAEETFVAAFPKLRHKFHRAGGIGKVQHEQT